MGHYRPTNRWDLFIFWGKGNYSFIYSSFVSFLIMSLPTYNKELILCRLQSILLSLECIHDGCSSRLHLLSPCSWLILGWLHYLLMCLQAVNVFLSIWESGTILLINKLVASLNAFSRSLQLLVLPIFFIGIILWAVMFSQFWKRKNSALLAKWVNYVLNIRFFFLFSSRVLSIIRVILHVILSWFCFYRWQISYSVGVEPGYKLLCMEWGSLQSPVKALRKWGTDKTNEKEVYQRNEWFEHLLRFRNDAIVIMSIIFLQLPFELAYAYLYEVIGSDVMK